MIHQLAYQYIKEVTRKGFFVGKVMLGNKRIFKMQGDIAHKNNIENICKIVLKKYQVTDYFDAPNDLGLPRNALYCKKWERWLKDNRSMAFLEIKRSDLRNQKKILADKIYLLSEALKDKMDCDDYLKTAGLLTELNTLVHKLNQVEQLG